MPRCNQTLFTALMLLFFVIFLSACTTTTAKKGDFEISRTAFGVNLSVPKLAIKSQTDGAFSLTMQGAESEGAETINAVVNGVLKGATIAAPSGL